MKIFDESVNRVKVSLALLLAASLFIETTSFLPNPFQYQKPYANGSLCVDFIPSNTTIRLKCGSATFSDLYFIIKKYKSAIGGIEDWVEKESNGIWFLNSSLVIASNSSFTINSSDTKWIKIYSDGKQAHSIKIHGNMTIDSVRITSWDPAESDYFHTIKDDSSDRRAYLSVMGEATGTTNITNSELAFLGYNSSQEKKHTPSNGLSFYGGNGSILRGNNIHDNNFGFYSARVGGLLIENNHIHHNTYYGLDPHMGTHDMTIQNNVVHDNGKMGIICKYCRNITIENNKVYNNTGSGISFSFVMQSEARNNTVYNQDLDGENGISVFKSNNNKIHNNTISFSDIGIKVIDNSSNNYVYNNSLQGIKEYSFLVRGSTSVNNTFKHNELDYSKTAVRLNNNSGSLYEANDDKDATSYGHEYLVQDNSTLTFKRTSFPTWSSITADNSSKNVINIYDSGWIIIRDMKGDITNFDTDVFPFTSRIYNETLSIISHNGTIQNNTT